MIGVLRVTAAIAAIARLVSFALLIPIPVAFGYEAWDLPLPGGLHVPRSAAVFGAAFVLACLFWVPARFFTRRIQHEDLKDREAYVTVALGWLAVAAFAMLPFLLSGTIRSPVQAYFEAMSGLTGTGATVLDDSAIRAMPDSLLFWRAFTQWLGGLGIIVLTVALLSKLTHGGLQLFRADVAGQMPTRVQPRLAEVARDLWRIYLAFTLLFMVALAAILYLHDGIPPRLAFFDGMVQTFSAYGNGAFLSHTGGTVADGPAELLLALMMLAGATNFTLVFLFLRRGRWRPLAKDAELRFYFAWVAAAVAAVIVVLWRFDAFYRGHPWEAVQHGAFNALSMATGSGLANSDYSLWPPAATVILFLLILVGGTAGSASGGVKAFRGLVLLRTVRRELRRLLHPRAIVPVRVGGRVVAEETLTAVAAFFFTYLIAWVAGTVLLALFEPGFTIDVAAGTSLSALGNVGTHFGPLAATGYGELHGYSQMLLTGLMWFGRMEILAAMLVFTPSTWKD